MNPPFILLVKVKCKMIYEIQAKFSHLKPLVENLDQYFQASSRVLQNERNEIRVINYQGEDYVVKAFRVPNLVNRIAYRYFRPSKAKRSYEYSIKIGEQYCPEAIAYIEEIRNGLLNKSYYISKLFDADFEVRALLFDESFENRSQILEEFAEFTYILHEKNILHRDYSPGNILVKKVGKSYTFRIVDINRMQFKALTLEDRLSNFSRLSVDDKTMKIIITRYAKCINQPVEEMLQQAINYRDKFSEKLLLKNKLRGR